VCRPTTGPEKHVCHRPVAHGHGRAPSDRTTKRHIYVCTHRILNSKDGAVTRKVMEFSADHPWTGYTTLGVCPHAPTAELSQALHQRYVLAAGQADTPPNQ
jgi:hypothetical protein